MTQTIKNSIEQKWDNLWEDVNNSNLSESTKLTMYSFFTESEDFIAPGYFKIYADKPEIGCIHWSVLPDDWAYIVFDGNYISAAKMESKVSGSIELTDYQDVELTTLIEFLAPFNK